jgi:CO/xanthine dehydrogenase Mo-binding subunit
MATTTYNVLGKPAARADGPEKVSGAAKYTVDVTLPGMLWGKALRSPYPHARIVRIDTSQARRLPGVHAVLTGEDVRGVLYGRRLRDVPVLANEKVRFIGERVAAVAAESEDIAEEALRLIEVEYEELPAVVTVEEATRDDAPVLHPDVNSYDGLPKPVEGRHLNLFAHDVWTKGDLDVGFAEADVVVEAEYSTPKGHQAYLEPHACAVWIDAEGRVQVWASNKAPYLMRQQISKAIGIPPETIRVNPTYIGGDFGGKGGPMDVPLAYFLAKASGRPVKLIMDYTEELLAANPRHAGKVRIKAGAKRDGTLTAWQATALWDSGAYGGFKPVPTVNLVGGQHLAGAYRVLNVRMDSYQVYTNTVPGGHYRAPGEPQAIFAAESHIDAMARAVGMDPYEFRQKNVLAEGDTTASGHHHEDVHAKETLEAAAKAAGYWDPKPQYVGRGMAMADHGAPGGETHAIVTVQESGEVLVQTPLFEQGAGQYTVLQQVVSEELGVPFNRIKVRPEDTDIAPFDSGIGGSHTTRIATVAAHGAGVDARQKLQRLAAELLGWAEERIALRDGRLVHEPSGEQVEIADLVRRAGQPVVGRGHVQDNSPSPMTSFGAQVAEVRVDPETGQVTLLKFTTAHDVGTIINPITHQGQLEGGVVQAIGFALMEELIVDESGRVANPSLSEFKVPTERDIPELRTVLLQSENGSGPYNIKSAGESSNTPTGAAIANAVEDAIGVRIRDLPITAEKVYRALREREQAQ